MIIYLFTTTCQEIPNFAIDLATKYSCIAYQSSDTAKINVIVIDKDVCYIYEVYQI